MSRPAHRFLSLGAGVQSYTMPLAARGEIPAFDAVFADTGWEPRAVYWHLLRGTFFLHASRVPLDEVVLRTRRILHEDRPGCGPWTCPHTEPVDAPVGASAGRREVA